ncbi:MAG: hypothetical protein WC308_04320 [archaeon]
MADIKEALERNFKNVYVCQVCNARLRCGTGKPPKCRKCYGKRIRQKKKRRKSV